MTPVPVVYKAAVVPAGTTAVAVVGARTVKVAAVLVPAVTPVLIVHPHEAEVTAGVLGQ